MTLRTVVATETHMPDWNASAGDWASLRIFGHAGEFERFCSVTVMRGDDVSAVIILHNWHPEAGVIEISAAGDGYWQTRRVINEVMAICFETMGCQMVVMRNAEHAVNTVSNSERLGFKGVFLPRMRGRDEGEWLFTLTDDDWKTSRLYKRP